MIWVPPERSSARFGTYVALFSPKVMPSPIIPIIPKIRTISQVRDLRAAPVAVRFSDKI